MSKFQAFMKGENKIKTKQVIISDRFVDEEGNEVPFVIRTLTSRELKECRNKAKVDDGEGNITVDNEIFENELIKKAVVSPDLNDSELQDSYGVMGEDQLLDEMLLAGEFTTLVKEINSHNMFGGYHKKVEKVKN